MLSLPAAILLLVGVGLLGFAFRTVAHPIAQKLALCCLLGITFLIGWLPNGSIGTGLLAVSVWLLIPWLEILFRIRHLRLPISRILKDQRPPSREIFPDLDALTSEVESHGFEHLEDTGWQWEKQEQFFRLFHRPEDRLQAAICSIEQDNVAFFYLSVATRTTDGQLWTTWNYPFSHVLKPAPHFHFHRASAYEDFDEILAQHRSFLLKNRVESESILDLDMEALREAMQNDLRKQIDHNLHAGLLLKSDDDQVRYSWRGLFFIWVQFVRDVVRL